MPLTSCPQCGKFNVFNASHCPDCGASLEGQAHPKPTGFAGLWSLWINECVQELWCIVIGISLILLGIFVPALGSAILQLVAIFTEDDLHMRRNIEEATPSAGDGWLVIGIGLLFIGFGAFGLYAAWEKNQRNLLISPADKEKDEQR